MGFLSDLFNIESSQFKIISKPTAIKEFSRENDNLKVLNELLLRLNSNEKKQLVNKEIIAIKMGLKGESTVDFELRNCTFPFLYLHDIRIEYDDLAVQIDYLVITKKYICVMETKQLLGDVNINKDGVATNKQIPLRYIHMLERGRVRRLVCGNTKTRHAEARRGWDIRCEFSDEKLE